MGLVPSTLGMDFAARLGILGVIAGISGTNKAYVVVCPPLLRGHMKLILYLSFLPGALAILARFKICLLPLLSGLPLAPLALLAPHSSHFASSHSSCFPPLH